MVGTPAPPNDTAVARAVLTAVRAVPGVADVSPGLFAEAATYGRGERVRGVVVRRTDGGVELEIHLAAAYAPSTFLPDLADRVRDVALRSVNSLGAGPVRRIDVAIDDVRVEAADR